MHWDVKTVKPLPNYRIYVEIEDGRKGIFDLKPYLDRGVFRELRNVRYFNQVSILLGAVTWPNEQDIAPETLLAEMLPLEQTGRDKEGDSLSSLESNLQRVSRPSQYPGRFAK
ncbi:MAG: DUF2442 domain-containing protein [Gammaproteobacteria bacterium]